MRSRLHARPRSRAAPTPVAWRAHRWKARAASLPAALCVAFTLCATVGGARASGDSAMRRARVPVARASQSPPATVTSPALPVTIAIDRFAPGPPVPSRFLGLSFEAAALTQIGQYAHRGDLVSLLRSLGPGVLRFGGITADENVGWTDPSTPPPPWASSTIGPAQMQAIGALARASGWRVLLTVGMAHYEPTAAAREVAAAHRALGPYLAAVEIGNEPDAYGNHGFRELPWLAQGYEEQVSGYREAIDALTPGVPIAGPDVSGSGAFSEWGEEEAIAQTPVLLTGHHYPLGCAQTPAPSIEALLSAETRGRQERSLAAYMLVAHRHGIPLRIDETNSVSCGGVAGISDTLAAALWAVGYVTQAMAAGTAGINLQSNPANCAGYTPVCAPTPATLATGALRVEPDWYALLLTRSLVGAHPLPIVLPTEDSPNLVVAAFLTPDHVVKVALVDDEPQGAPPLALRLNAGPGMGAASVMRLTAPSPAATEGVLLAGRAVSANGAWRPPAQPEPVPVEAGVATLQLQPASAALVTIDREPPKPRRARKTVGR